MRILGASKITENYFRELLELVKSSCPGSEENWKNWVGRRIQSLGHFALGELPKVSRPRIQVLMRIGGSTSSGFMACVL